MRAFSRTNQFKKDVKRAEKRGKDMAKLKAMLDRLIDGEPLPPFAPVPYFWSDQYDAKIQFVGTCAPDDEVRIVHGSVAERRFVAIYGRAGRLVGALALSRPRLLVAYRRLIAERASWEDALAHEPT